MQKALSSGFHLLSAKNRPAWFPEILSAGVFFFCVVATFQGLWRLDRITSGNIADLQDRLSFVSRFSGLSGLQSKPARNTKDADAGQIISEVRSLAQSSGAQIERFAIGLEARQAKQKVSALAAELNVVLPQSSLLSFISGLKQMGFLCRIVSLSVRPDTSADDNLKVILKIERLRLLAPVDRAVLRKAASDLDITAAKTGLVSSQNKKIFKSAVEPKRRIVEAPSPANEAFDTNNFSLVGVIEDSGLLKAVIEDKKAGKSIFLAKDDQLGNMRVAEISRGEVILEGPSGRYSLTL